jgi:hypothetical protein
MSIIQKLEDAIRERIAKENAFKDSVVAHINEILSKLSICDNSNTSPEVSNTVNLSKTKLDSILAKLNEYSNINQNAAKELISKLNTKNVRKGITRRNSLGNIDEFMRAHSSESQRSPKEDLFANPSNVQRAFRMDPNSVDETHFGGKRTKSRRR